MKIKLINKHGQQAILAALKQANGLWAVAVGTAGDSTVILADLSRLQALREVTHYAKRLKREGYRRDTIYQRIKNFFAK